MKIFTINPKNSQGYDLKETGELINTAILSAIGELSAIFTHIKIIKESVLRYQDESFDYNFACKQYPIPDIDSDTYDKDLEQQKYFNDTLRNLIHYYLKGQTKDSLPKPEDWTDHFILVNPTNNVTATININDEVISIYYHNPNQN